MREGRKKWERDGEDEEEEEKEQRQGERRRLSRRLLRVPPVAAQNKAMGQTCDWCWR